MLKRLFLLSFFAFFSLCAIAQVPSSISASQLQQTNVDNLSDDQIRQAVQQMKQRGLSFGDIDSYGQQQGISPEQTQKLKQRIQQLNLDKELDGTMGNSPIKKSIFNEDEDADRQLSDSADYVRKTQQQNWQDRMEERERIRRMKKIFGSELFNSQNLTFEPNLRMPTPTNYRLAANDEILIDISGYSDDVQKLKVTSEGYIRIPNLGPVYVNGLTMEEAKARIIKQLSSIYSGIKTGQTVVNISLGAIRTIRVLLIGEVNRPGNYSLPSLATVMNALYASGGPSENGSFRNIQVYRNGAVAATFDLYAFLMNGDLRQSIVLQDQDIIKVNAYDIHVELQGAVKRPAIFEVKPEETLADVLHFAGGFNDMAYKDVIKASRINNHEKQIVSVTPQEAGTFHLKTGDLFLVDSIVNRYTNRITIAGAVFHPGEYQLDSALTLGALIRKADGLKEDASLTRGIIRRLKSDYMPAMLSFNVGDVVSGKADIPLQREDSVVIYSKQGLREAYLVQISGEVNNEGYFNFADSMRLEDLILMAGGLKDAASVQHVEVTRRIRKEGYDPQDPSMAIVKQFDLNKELSSAQGDLNFVLEPFDQVYIRKEPSYSEQATVNVDGEVVYAGNFTIQNRKEHLSDLVGRAGGLRTEAFPEGAVLLRKTFTNGSDSALLANKLGVFYSKLMDSSTNNRVRENIERNYQVVDINLQKVMANPHSKYDLLVENGDILKVPKKLQTVQLFGEVYFPKKERYDASLSFREYIRGAGGFTSQSLRRRSYVVYANGEVKNTRKIFFFNSYPKLKPGAEIYVPAKSIKPGVNAQELIGFTTGIAALAAIIVTLLK
ncbi:SLBB domain-containing protein [Chitinophaga costaii]|nr:SLBB domain-containing protein [Chitinophaga costaii]